MVTITSGTVKIHNSGDQKKIVMDLTAIANSQTLVIPHLRVAEDFVLVPTTEVDYGITVSGATLTFLTSTTIAGRLTVYGR